MKTDVVIIGGGPGGLTSSILLEQAGIKSVVVEKEKFPRYHIGESLTGEAGKTLRLLGLEDKMQFSEYPIKYGVRVYGKEGKNSFWVPVMARDPEGKLFPTSTWQVRRSEFDQMLLDKCLEVGTTFIHGEAIKPIGDSSEIKGVSIRQNDDTILNIESSVLIDASGQGTFLANKGVTGKKIRGKYDKQVAIFSQLKGALRDSGNEKDNTLIFYRDQFHWAWFIPLDDETVSVGVSVPTEYFLSRKEGKQEFLQRELQELNPQLALRTKDCELTEETRSITAYSYEVKNFTGKGYLCIGDAHRFIDPIFSFGVYFSMKEAEFAVEAVKDFLQGKTSTQSNPFADYENLCQKGMDTIQDLIDGFWNNPLAFGYLAHFRHREDIINLFAGRVYDETPSQGLMALRQLNASAVRSARENKVLVQSSKA